MKDIDAVNHPSHYEKGDGHIECIDLLQFITEGYKGIYALDIGQSKYAYRAGTKGEADLSIEEKTVQDFKKLRWYLNDFYKRVCSEVDKNGKDFISIVYDGHCKKYDPVIANILQNEFSYDKPERIKEYVRQYINIAYRMTCTADLCKAIGLVEKIISSLSEESTN